MSAFCQAAKSNPAFANRDPRRTLKTLAGNRRLIEIEGYNPRANTEEMQERYDELYAIVKEMQPMIVRQVFYQATVKQLDRIDKSDSGYNKVQQALVKMRRGRVKPKVPYDWIIDNTRWERKPYTYDNIREALEDTVRQYRKSLWKDADVCVQIWLEKDGLAGVVEEITEKYDIPLMVARGFSSITFLHESAEKLPSNRTAYIYHLGDSDWYGKNAASKIEEDLREYAPHVELHFERLAVTEEQIKRWNLPTRPDKVTDEPVVELDAIDPRQLRKLVKDAINRHMSDKKYEELIAIQEREEERLREIIDQINEDTDFDDIDD